MKGQRMNREHAQRVYFEQLKRAVSIESRARTVRHRKLKGRGASAQGCCPIHDGSNPRSSSSIATRASGTASATAIAAAASLEFVAEMEHVDIRDAAS